jgi:indolepyruvate ferredoxin oxidoreductase alpha subunit
VADALAAPRRSYDRIILPPSTYQQEREKIDKRWPAAVEFVARHALNERHDGDLCDIGIVLQGGSTTPPACARATRPRGCLRSVARSAVRLNVTYPLVPAELAAFAEGKRALLVVEEGQPEYLEQSIGMLLRQAGLATEVIGKGPFPRAGEYTGAVMRQGVEAFVERYRPEVLRPAVRTPAATSSDPYGSNRCCRRPRSQGRCPRAPRVCARVVRSDRSLRR